MLITNGVEEEYFEWLYDYVAQTRTHHNVSYRRLFECLHEIEFTWYFPLDENRASDGMNLRSRFATIKDDRRVVDILYGPCSVLEMMVALAIRCEEEIMDNTGYGNRTSQWFWDMMSNLGIGSMTDDVFDREYVEDCIYKFLDRQYNPNGKGGLFYIRGCKDDLRDVEIWTQLCWYLDNFV